MDMDVGDDLILGWDWISSHDLQHLFQAGQVDLWSGSAQLQLALLPSAARSPSASLSTVISHGELRRLLRQIVSIMNQALKVGLGTPSAVGGGVPGASGPLGRCTLVYMDDCLVHSPTL